GEIGTGRPAGRRPGIAPADQGRGARIGRGADIGRAQMAAISFQMLLPALWQEFVEIGMRMDARMDVAIDDAQPRRSGFFLLQGWTVDDVTHASLPFCLSMILVGKPAATFPGSCSGIQF